VLRHACTCAYIVDDVSRLSFAFCFSHPRVCLVQYLSLSLKTNHEGASSQPFYNLIFGKAASGAANLISPIIAFQRPFDGVTI